MPPGVPAHRPSDTDDVEPNALLVFRAGVLRDVSRGTLPNGARAFLVYVDGLPSGWCYARSGRAAEARERRARRVPAHDGGRVHAVWVPAAPLADLARALLAPPPRAHSGPRCPPHLPLLPRHGPRTPTAACGSAVCRGV